MIHISYLLGLGLQATSMNISHSAVGQKIGGRSPGGATSHRHLCGLNLAKGERLRESSL
jgi:hypothetical protein